MYELFFGRRMAWENSTGDAVLLFFTAFGSFRKIAGSVLVWGGGSEDMFCFTCIDSFGLCTFAWMLCLQLPLSLFPYPES